MDNHRSGIHDAPTVKVMVQEALSPLQLWDANLCSFHHIQHFFHCFPRAGGMRRVIDDNLGDLMQQVVASFRLRNVVTHSIPNRHQNHC